MRNPNCTKCRLHETARTVYVESRGSDHPTILFVGEAPGFEEDQKGRCFIGPAGQLLEQAIKEYGLTPSYITNTVRCRPPGNRKPRADEIEACFPYLAEEIKRLNPKIVVALGNVALKALTGMEGISSFSGTVVQHIGGIQVFALYHPSFVLREPGNLPKFEMHLRELKKIISGDKYEEPVKVIDVVPREAFDILVEAKDLVAFDYETTGLFKSGGGRIRAVGFYDGDQAFVVNAEKHRDTPKLMRYFLNSGMPKAAYNSAFEIRWSKEEYGLEPKNLIEDPYLLYHLLDENLSMDLESVASRYFKAGRWDITPLMLEKGWTYATIPYENLFSYCGLDCYWTWKLSKNPEIGQPKEDPYNRILIPLARLCADMEISGIKIDRKWAANIDYGYGVEQARLLKQIRGDEVIRAYEKLKKQKQPYFEFNPGSHVQLRDIFFGKLGFRTDKKTKKGGLMSTDQEVMDKLKNSHPLVKIYLSWKHITTRRNDFTIKFPKYCDKQGLIHPHYNPIGTVTGRLSASEPPAHTFPKPDEEETDTSRIRGMVTSRFPGGRLVSSDYKQLELRLLASEAEEESLLEAFSKGEDPHGLTASRIFGKNFTKQQRAIGKTINFAIGYGIQAQSLSGKFNVGYEIAEQWISHFWKGYPAMYLWLEKQHKFAKATGWIGSRFGRIRHLPELPELLKIQEKERQIKWRIAALLRQAGNFPIQSAGADINNLASIEVHKMLKAENRASCLFLTVHDSILVDCPKDEIRPISVRIKAIMEEGIQKQCPWMRAGLEIDQKIEERWGNG